MPNGRKDNAEDILSAFAVEPTHDRETLNLYLEQYPELATELIDLSLELEMADPTNDELFDTDSPTVNAAWAVFKGASAKSAPITAASFTREVAVALGIKLSALMGLRDKKVEVHSLPIGFTTRLSKALATSAEGLRDYLSGLQTMPAGASFKSDAKPLQKSKVTIEQLLAECGHTPEEIADILRES
ncbi:hypothetical protein [Rhizobium sullae]|uniref:Uncharacterized protein n=1 Tax=Rhizobium sullae TaxID=50338 RepID=A0A4R3Q742_RHISU|nr:hypothetical protein [Rhizobium sullae]TCU16394.1 hypothetical protein EV132_105146 [Rhizobium sullae]